MRVDSISMETMWAHEVNGLDQVLDALGLSGESASIDGYEYVIGSVDVLKGGFSTEEGRRYLAQRTTSEYTRIRDTSRDQAEESARLLGVTFWYMTMDQSSTYARVMHKPVLWRLFNALDDTSERFGTASMVDFANEFAGLSINAIDSEAFSKKHRRYMHDFTQYLVDYAVQLNRTRRTPVERQAGPVSRFILDRLTIGGNYSEPYWDWDTGDLRDNDPNQEGIY